MGILVKQSEACFQDHTENAYKSSSFTRGRNDPSGSNVRNSYLQENL